MKTITKTENRGRKAIEIKIPVQLAKRKRGFTVEEIAAVQKVPVSTVTVRNRLNELTQVGKLQAEAVPGEGRGHPVHIYSLVS